MTSNINARLLNALIGCALLGSASSGWAQETQRAAAPAETVASVPAAVSEASPPVIVAWDRVGISASGFSA